MKPPNFSARFFVTTVTIFGVTPCGCGGGGTSVRRVEQRHVLPCVGAAQVVGLVEPHHDTRPVAHITVFIDGRQCHGSGAHIVAVVPDGVGIDIVLGEIACQSVVYTVLTTLRGPADAAHRMDLLQDIRHADLVDPGILGECQIGIARIRHLIFLHLSISKVVHQHIPYGDDMTDAARQHEEVEHRVHVLLLIERIEDGPRDIADALGDNPDDGCRRHGVDQRLEGHEHAQPHPHEAEGLQVGMLLQPDEAHDGARYRTEPDKGEEAPAPVALTAERHQRQRRIGARNVPVDGRMVPLPEPLLPLRVVLHRVIQRGGRVAAQHTEEIEDDPYPRPVVVCTETPDEEDDAEHHAQQDAPAMRRGIPYLLFPCIPNHNCSNDG